MKKNWYSLFTVLFLLLCAAPLLFMPLLGPSEAAANEVLASRPIFCVVLHEAGQYFICLLKPPIQTDLKHIQAVLRRHDRPWHGVRPNGVRV